MSVSAEGESSMSTMHPDLLAVFRYHSASHLPTFAYLCTKHTEYQDGQRLTNKRRNTII